MTILRAASFLATAMLFLAAPAHSQVYSVTFKDPKTAKRFPTACITLPDGQPALVGEAKAGIKLVNGQIQFQGDKGSNELWVVNTADPTLVPYKLEGTSYANAGVKNGVVTLTGNQIAAIQIAVPKQSLYGLAREYRLRKSEVDEQQKRRDSNKAGSPDWSAAHARMVAQMERLDTWLGSTVFPEAAKKLEAEIEKQKKTVAKEARAARLATALASVHLQNTPPKLLELAKSLAPDAAFKVQESTHLRITYASAGGEALGDEQVKGMLELGEKMIDGFRADFVDPYVGDDFADQIPDTQFMEFWFGPSEKNAHEHFLTDWYGVSWGDHKDDRVAAMSGRYRRKTTPEYLDYWKISDNKDFEAIVAHQLGHILANLHCNAGRAGDLPSWIEEGTGYWLALSYLGKNGVTCKQFEKDEYAKPASGTTVERSVFLGESELFLRVALTAGPGSDTLLRKPLHQMDDGSLAKSWSFFEWVGRDGGKNGQLWLRALCDIYCKSGPSLKEFRAKSEELFGVSGDDVFKVLDERWRKHAEGLLEAGGETKKK